jgi:hypothetical protein
MQNWTIDANRVGIGCAMEFSALFSLVHLLTAKVKQLLSKFEGIHKNLSILKLIFI